MLESPWSRLGSINPNLPLFLLIFSQIICPCRDCLDSESKNRNLTYSTAEIGVMLMIWTTAALAGTPVVTSRVNCFTDSFKHLHVPIGHTSKCPRVILFYLDTSLPAHGIIIQSFGSSVCLLGLLTAWDEFILWTPQCAYIGITYLCPDYLFLEHLNVCQEHTYLCPWWIYSLGALKCVRSILTTARDEFFILWVPLWVPLDDSSFLGAPQCAYWATYLCPWMILQLGAHQCVPCMNFILWAAPQCAYWEKRLVGKECLRQCRYRWVPCL